MRNATLVGVVEIKSGMRSAQTDLKAATVKITELELDAKAIQQELTHGLGRINDTLRSVLVDTKSGLAVAENMDRNMKAVLAQGQLTKTNLASKDANNCHTYDTTHLLTFWQTKRRRKNGTTS